MQLPCRCSARARVDSVLSVRVFHNCVPPRTLARRWEGAPRVSPGPRQPTPRSLSAPSSPGDVAEPARRTASPLHLSSHVHNSAYNGGSETSLRRVVSAATSSAGRSVTRGPRPSAAEVHNLVWLPGPHPRGVFGVRRDPRFAARRRSVSAPRAPFLSTAAD